MCHIPLFSAAMGDAESCREQESPEDRERVEEKQTEKVDVSHLAPRY